MKYRGFNIKSKISYETLIGENKYDICEVDIFKDLHGKECELLDQFEIYRKKGNPNSANEYFNKKIVEYINANFVDLHQTSTYYEYARKAELLGNAMSWISENHSGAELYNTFSQVIGLADDEIAELGFTSLTEFFDRDRYAKTIADYLIDEGTENTTSGNLHFSFDEINRKFGVSLPQDADMLDKIAYNLMDGDNSLIVSDVITDSDIDIMFYTLFCPNAADEMEEEPDEEQGQTM